MRKALHAALAVFAAALPLALSATQVLADCVPRPNDREVKSTGGTLVGDDCITIQRLPIIPNPHVEACSVTVDDEIWVVTGSVNSWSNNGRPMLPTKRTDIYSPKDNKWYEGPKVKIPRICYPNVYNVNGTLFLVGGFQETAPDSGQFEACRRVEVCRPDGAGFNGLGVNIPAGNKEWHLLPEGYSMPAGMRNMWNRSTAVVGDTLYLFAPGRTMSFNTVTGVWRGDLATRAGANGNFSCAITYNNKIYVAGGCGGPSPGCPEASFFTEYNPATNSFRDLARFPNPGLAEHTMEIVGGNKILVVGGDFNGTALYYYDPATNLMVQRESMPENGVRNLYARSDHVSGTANGRIYVLGGIVAGTTNVQPESLAIGLP